MFLKIRQKLLIIFFLVNVNSESIKKDNKYLKSSLEIPVINSDNIEVNNKVNKKIKEDIMNFQEESLKEAQSFLDDFELDESNFVADASFEVKKNTNNVISILIKYYKYSGGAHGYYEYVPYNINLKNGNMISLKEIFKSFGCPFYFNCLFRSCLCSRKCF